MSISSYNKKAFNSNQRNSITIDTESQNYSVEDFTKKQIFQKKYENQSHQILKRIEKEKLN
jgi:hypothetical protein